MPDLNSVPASPRIVSLSRRTSAQQMPPPPSVPASGTPPTDPALNILPSNLNAVTTGAPVAPSLPSPRLSQDAAAFTSGPGPMRHPRPLTHAELHSELEKEGEAVVCSRDTFENAYVSSSESNSLYTGQPPHSRARPPPPSTQCLRRIQRILQLRERLRLRSGHPHDSRRQTASAFRYGLLDPFLQRASPQSQRLERQRPKHSSHRRVRLSHQHHLSSPHPPRRLAPQSTEQHSVSLAPEPQRLARPRLLLGIITHGRRHSQRVLSSPLATNDDDWRHGILVAALRGAHTRPSRCSIARAATRDNPIRGDTALPPRAGKCQAGERCVEEADPRAGAHGARETGERC